MWAKNPKIEKKQSSEQGFVKKNTANKYVILNILQILSKLSIGNVCKCSLHTRPRPRGSGEFCF
jgi:hypothetical protein